MYVRTSLFLFPSPFSQLFLEISGAEAKVYFGRAKVPTDKLAAIWSVSERVWSVGVSGVSP